MKNYIIALIATLIIVGGVMYHRMEVTALEEAKNKLIEQVNTPTELEKIQQYIKSSNYDIEGGKEHIKKLEERIETDKILYNSIVWAKRCYETKAELEIKVIDNNLNCRVYAIYNGTSYDFSVIEIVGEQEDFEFLEKFASYNISNTRKELGLN